MKRKILVLMSMLQAVSFTSLCLAEPAPITEAPAQTPAISAAAVDASQAVITQAANTSLSTTDFMDTTPLSTAAEASIPNLPISKIAAPSNSNFNFIISTTQTGTQLIFLQNKQTGKSSFIAAVPKPADPNAFSTVGGLDVDPTGQTALINIQRHSLTMIKPGDGETGLIFTYSITEGKIKSPALGIGQVSSAYVFQGDTVLYNVSSTVFTGTTVIKVERGAIADMKTLQVTHTPSLYLNYGVVANPAKGQLLIGASNGLKNSILMYDPQTKSIVATQDLPSRGFGGIKGVSPDGNTVIVASSINTVYIVPVNPSMPVKMVTIPIPLLRNIYDYVLSGAQFIDNYTVKLVVKNGKQYSLDLRTMTLTEI